jgi:hypothetical protein
MKDSRILKTIWQMVFFDSLLIAAIFCQYLKCSWWIGVGVFALILVSSVVVFMDVLNSD